MISSSGSNGRSSSNVLAQISSERIKKANSLDDHNEVEDVSGTSKLLGRKASIRLKIQARGPICNSRKQAGLSRSSSEEKHVEEGGWAKNFEKEEWSDDVDDTSSSWLSTGISSPSSCIDDQIFRNLLDFSLDDWLVYLLITSISPGRTKTSFDGPRVNQFEKATFVLQRSSYPVEIFQENGLSEEDVATLLLNSVEFEDEDRLCSTIRRNFELLQNWEIQKMGFFGSLIDLDGENSEWICDTDINFPQIDFPSPSCNSSWSIESQSSIAPPDAFSIFGLKQKENESISIDTEAEENEFADYGAVEPLFWPCDTKYDWGSEFSWDFLIMSPRKNTHKLGKSKENLHKVMHRAKMDFKREDNNVGFNSTWATTDNLEPHCSSRVKDFGEKNVA